MRTDIELLTFGPRKILNTAQQVTQGQLKAMANRGPFLLCLLV